MKRNLDINKFQDPGTGVSYSKKTERLFRDDGSFNVKKVGRGIGATGLYQNMLNISWFSYILYVFLFLVSLNAIFAFIYLIIGVQKFGIEPANLWKNYLESFYFSVQTFTTVGYGGLLPTGHLPNLIASLEMLVGLISMAIVTGVTYGKFSKPRAKMIFSKNGLIAPYQEEKAFMFRFANQRSTQLIEVDAQVILSWEEKEGNRIQRKYNRLELERDHIMFFPLSWTVVHPIHEESPLFYWSEKEYAEKNIEFLILVSGYDDTYNQTVYQKHSYTANQIIWNGKFKKAFHVNKTNHVVFDLNQLHDYDKL